MSPVSHHEGRSLASQFLAPFLSTGFASTGDLALMKLRSFASERIMALVHAKAWALWEKGAIEAAHRAVRWITKLDTTFVLVTGIAIVFFGDSFI